MPMLHIILQERVYRVSSAEKHIHGKIVSGPSGLKINSTRLARLPLARTSILDDDDDDGVHTLCGEDERPYAFTQGRPARRVRFFTRFTWTTPVEV